MEKLNNFETIYDPPFFVHKVNNYQKGVYERKGHWTQKQKIKYGVFLEIFRDKFEDRENPILNKMFRVMSDFIKTRNHNQCRSHHQKMERERFQIESILESIKSKYHPRQYELFFEKYSRHIKAVNLDVVLNEKGFTPHKNVEKRRKNRMIDIQTKLLNQEIKLKQMKEIPKSSKIENIDSNSEVLKQSLDDAQPQEKNKIQLLQKQISISISKNQKMIEEQNSQHQINNNQVLMQKLSDEKQLKDQKKTGLQYDSDSDVADQKPKIAYVQIPLDFHMPSQKSNFNQSMGLNLGMTSDFHHSMASQPSASQISIPPFDHFPNFDSQFSSNYRAGPNSYGHEENYSVSMKQLDQRKKWHLSEASRLCAQMNEHLQRANACQQMKEMMVKQVMELRRGYFYPNGFASSQF